MAAPLPNQALALRVLQEIQIISYLDACSSATSDGSECHERTFPQNPSAKALEKSNSSWARGQFNPISHLFYFRAGVPSVSDKKASEREKCL